MRWSSPPPAASSPAGNRSRTPPGSSPATRTRWCSAPPRTAGCSSMPRPRPSRSSTASPTAATRCRCSPTSSPSRSRSARSRGRTLAFLGDCASNMALSFFEAAPIFDFRLRLLGARRATSRRRSGCAPPAGHVTLVAETQPRRWRARTWSSTDVWTSMGQEAEADQRRAALRGYTLDEALLGARCPGGHRPPLSARAPRRGDHRRRHARPPVAHLGRGREPHARPEGAPRAAHPRLTSTPGSGLRTRAPAEAGSSPSKAARPRNQRGLRGRERVRPGQFLSCSRWWRRSCCICSRRRSGT